MNVVNSLMFLPLYLFVIAVLDGGRSCDTLSDRRRFWPRGSVVPASVVPALDVCCVKRRHSSSIFCSDYCELPLFVKVYSSLWVL